MWQRKLAGHVRLAAWVAAIYCVAAPWRWLGGIVDERVRWLEWAVIALGLPIAVALGKTVREAAERDPERNHPRGLRLLFYPPASVTAAGLVFLAFTGRSDFVGVLTTAFLVWWAGVDVGFRVVALMEGRPSRPERAADGDEALWEELGLRRGFEAPPDRL